MVRIDYGEFVRREMNRTHVIHRLHVSTMANDDYIILGNIGFIIYRHLRDIVDYDNTLFDNAFRMAVYMSSL